MGECKMISGDKSEKIYYVSSKNRIAAGLLCLLGLIGIAGIHRMYVGKWKTGYHKIATAVGGPVYLGYFDWGTKRIGRGQKFELTDDPVADTKRIQEIYEAMHLQGKHRENYATHL